MFHISLEMTQIISIRHAIHHHNEQKSCFIVGVFSIIITFEMMMMLEML